MGLPTRSGAIMEKDGSGNPSHQYALTLMSYSLFSGMNNLSLKRGGKGKTMICDSAQQGNVLKRKRWKKAESDPNGANLRDIFLFLDEDLL